MKLYVDTVPDSCEMCILYVYNYEVRHKMCNILNNAPLNKGVKIENCPLSELPIQDTINIPSVWTTTDNKTTLE
jgi:hypothetical protein